jgi:single-strand DNA-binding protein
MLNKATLIGYIGKDPEIRTMQSGDEMAQLSLATSEKWKDKKTGERKERTEWHRVVIFNKGLVTLTKQYLKKGLKIYLEGQIETRKYTDKDGSEKYTTEIVLRPFNGQILMLESSKNTDNQDQYYDDYSQAQSQDSNVNQAQNNDFDDEIPF